MFQFVENWHERWLEKKSGFADPNQWLVALLNAGIVTLAGSTVGPAAALRCPAVACAVRAISEPLGQLPVHVFQRGQGGARERDATHPVYRLLHDEANAWTSASDFRTQLSIDALLHGNGYGFVNRVDGRPIEMVRIAPTEISALIDRKTREPVYKIGNEPLDRRNVLHIRCSLSHDGLNGESPIKLASEAIGLALTLEAAGAKLFAKGAQPGGILTSKSDLSPSAIERALKIFNAQTAGAENIGKTIMLPAAFEYARFGLSNVDSQFLELRKYAVDEIARAFRVPPHLLFELGRATWGNAADLTASFVKFTLAPWLRIWEGAIRRTLFTEEERDTYFAEFLLDDLLRADLGARAEAYTKLIAAKVLSPNECRAMENRPPYDGGDEFSNPNVAPGPSQPPLRAAA